MSCTKKEYRDWNKNVESTRIARCPDRRIRCELRRKDGMMREMQGELYGKKCDVSE